MIYDIRTPNRLTVTDEMITPDDPINQLKKPISQVITRNKSYSMAGRDTWALFDLRNVHAVVDSNLTDRLLLMWCNGAGGGLSCLVGAIAYPVIQAGYVNMLIFNSYIVCVCGFLIAFC